MENGSMLSVTQSIASKPGLYLYNGMRFPVTVLDARRIYGRVDVLIKPINGSGEKWVESSFVTMK